MRKTDRADAAPLPDEEERRAIREDLGTTLLVEASAGTGKTQSLIDRMAALVATGTTLVDRLSAVTFTIRAAAQLRQRFQNALEKALREETDGVRRTHLAAALDGIDSCFIGTIHAFAARLLRERPVEAGLDPRFREMDEPQDGVARGEAWDRFCEGLFFQEDRRLARLIELGIPLDDLRESFQKLCDNSDVEVAAGAAGPEPNFSRARRAIEEFLDRAVRALPAQAPAGGWTGFQEAVRRAERLRGLLDSSRGADFVQILRVFRASSAAKGSGAFRKFFETLQEEVVQPALAAWGEHVYPDVMAVLVEARDQYAAWRRREGRLNFQDLLVYARDLLRDHPHVREALRRRFTPILVDEFQDTDPIQAEILFYLTGASSDEKDWRRLTPVAGSLFVVGDPKQSIYRFRRADIQTYQVVRDRISRCGRVLRLSVNFRSNAALCEWVNGVFGRCFPKAPTREQPSYAPLVPCRPERPPGPVVFRIATYDPSRANQPVVDHDAARIADCIAAAVREGQRRPGDFLLLFRKRKFMTDYARAIEDRGIPYEQGGGDAFGDSQELADLLMPLAALADPDDPVPLVAALRGPILGVDDEALYRYVRAGGRFSFRSDVPLSADPRIREAFGLLRSAETLVETLPPAAAIARFAERVGWVALAASRNLGESRAGNLLKALAAARGLSAEGLGFPAVVRELARLRQESLIEQMSVEPGRPDAVRLLTLHGAKGLEAPVVFLAEPASRAGRARSFWIDRDSEPPRGYFRLARSFGDFGDEEIARPPGWEDMERAEKEFDAAENRRLLYVGATRAQEALVVSLRTSKDGKASGPWSELASGLATDLPQPGSKPVPEAPSGGDTAPDPQTFRYRRAERRRLSGEPTYAVVSVTTLSHSAADARPPREDTGRGMEWGRIIHGLLEALMRDAALDVRAYAANLFAEEERQAGDLEEAVRLVEAVRGSPLWRRALAAKRRLVEVPFAVSVDSRELGRSEGPKHTLLSGAIDLAFEEDDGWTLVDYKSDRVDGKLAALAAFYAPQIRLYRGYWERLTRRRTRAGLFFVETGEEAWLPEA
jgi:ATP-dependent helicase/nuclease subunit A